MEISHKKRFPIRFAALPLINRLCTHAQSCQTLSELPITTVTSLPTAQQPLTHTHTYANTQMYTGHKHIGIDEWVSR